MKSKRSHQICCPWEVFQEVYHQADFPQQQSVGEYLILEINSHGLDLEGFPQTCVGCPGPSSTLHMSLCIVVLKMWVQKMSPTTSHHL